MQHCHLVPDTLQLEVKLIPFVFLLFAIFILCHLFVVVVVLSHCQFLAGVVVVSILDGLDLTLLQGY